MKLTKYKISLISLAMVLLIALSAFFGLQSLTAAASGTTSATNTFKKSGDNVSILAAQRDVSTTEKNYYMAFRFVNGEETEENKSYVYYSNSLAYSWYENNPQTDTDPEGEDKTYDRIEHGWFNMELGFDDVNFERYVITFESQQYIKTKDAKTANYVMFFPAGKDEDGKDLVYVHVTDNEDDTVDSIEETDKKALGADHIRIEFYGRSPSDPGSYMAKVHNENKSSVLGSVEDVVGYTTYFKNIGGNYAKRVTSGTTVYPLIFKADFKEDAESTASTAMVLYSLNGQEMAAKSGTLDVSTTSYYTLNNITDDTPPVLCLENEFKFFKQGAKIDFDYVVLDVLRTSASGKINYYVLDKDQKKKGEEFDYLNKDLYNEVGDSDVLETDYDAYLPVANDVKGTDFDSIYDANGNKNTDGHLYVDMLVQVYVHIYDVSATSSSSENADIYLHWYLPSENTVTVNGTPFIAVAKDSLGVKFNYDGGKDGRSWEKIVENYQAEVTKAAADLSAGSSNYFYLPSAESLFADNSTAYSDMKISIYYYGNSEQNSSSLATSNLSINVTSQGAYTFTVYATDAAGNNMYYLDDKNEVVEFAASEIWTMFKDKEKKDKLPWFTFDVKYTGVEFEETPGMQSTGYVGTPYDSASFEVNGVDYSTVYRLFYFNRDVYYKDTNKSFTYEEFIAAKDDLFNNAETRKYFTEIVALDKMEETDEEYAEFADYGWSNATTSFTPQAAGYYYMLAEVSDKLYEAEPVTCSLAVVVSEASKSLKGESDWLKNNMVSVILLAVAALALIGIILLLVIKPKNKEDIDVRFEEKKNKKKSK